MPHAGTTNTHTDSATRNTKLQNTNILNAQTTIHSGDGELLRKIGSRKAYNIQDFVLLFVLLLCLSMRLSFLLPCCIVPLCLLSYIVFVAHCFCVFSGLGLCKSSCPSMRFLIFLGLAATFDSHWFLMRCVLGVWLCKNDFS